MQALKNILIISFSISLFAIFLNMAANLFEWYALAPYPPTETEAVVEETVLLNIAVFFVLTALFMVLTLIVTGVLYLIWIFQLHKRARMMMSKASIYHPGLVVGSYFIPLLNWIMPVIAMWQMNQAQVKRLHTPSAHVWILIWWGAILLTAFLNIAMLDYDMAVTIEELRSNALIFAISEFALIVAGVALLSLIHIMTKRLFMMEKFFAEENNAAELSQKTHHS